MVKTVKQQCSRGNTLSKTHEHKHLIREKVIATLLKVGQSWWTNLHVTHNAQDPYSMWYLEQYGIGNKNSNMYYKSSSLNP